MAHPPPIAGELVVVALKAVSSKTKQIKYRYLKKKEKLQLI